jgi:NAD(P)H-dependent FMN reductase
VALNLKIIIGSTRETRSAEAVAPFVERVARAHGDFDVEVLDLRDWPLPLFQEHAGTILDISNPTYSEPIVKAWNDKIKEADAFIFVTPEYNYAIPGVLKNAIDNVFLSYGFRNKPVLPVAYSVGAVGGARAVLSLTSIALETEMHLLRMAVLIGNVGQAFEDGEPINPATRATLDVGLEDLAWWGSALKTARVNGQHLPGNARVQARLQPAAMR